MIKIGQLLISKKLLTSEQLDKALDAQRIYGGKLGTNLVELGFVKDRDLVRILSEQLRIPAANAEDFEKIPNEALQIVTADFAKAHKLVPIRVDQRLHIAISDAGDVEAIDQLGFKTGKQIRVWIAPEIWVVAALERYYNVARETRYVTTTGEDDFLKTHFTSDISTDVSVDYEGKYETVQKAVSVDQFLEELANARAKEDVFEILLAFLGSVYPRTAVYVSRKDTFHGWRVRGLPIHSKEFTQVRVSREEETPLRTVATTGSSFQGELMKAQAAKIGLELLQIPFGQEIRLYPIFLQGKVISILLGIPNERKGPMNIEDEARVMMACKKASLALELLFLRGKILSKPELVEAT